MQQQVNNTHIHSFYVSGIITEILPYKSNNAREASFSCCKGRQQREKNHPWIHIHLSVKSTAESPIILMDTEETQRKKKRIYVNYNKRTQSISESISGIYSK